MYEVYHIILNKISTIYNFRYYYINIITICILTYIQTCTRLNLVGNLYNSFSFGLATNKILYEDKIKIYIYYF